MKYLSTFVTAFIMLIATISVAQDNFRDKFEEANVLMDDKYYALAMPIWKELATEDPENSNLNYKLGLCYYNASTGRTRALSHLEKAVENTTKNYDMFSHVEKKAPIESFYYLARIYHIDYQLDKAIEYFGKFKDIASKKHYLLKDVTRQVQMCLNAKELVNAPVNLSITNLGKIINSEYPEYSPVVSLDESTMYFTSRRLRADSSNLFFKDIKDALYFEDIYVSYKDKNGQWGEPELLNINRPDEHYATIGLSADGQTLYLYIDDEGDGNIYESFLVGDRWTTPELMGSDINTNAYETHVTITADGKTLYFVSDRKGGYGGKDIYRCVKLPNGEWSKALNLGDVINTPYDEDGPFIHPDGVTMFFSSTGHKSIGGYDIFFTSLQDGINWTQPINIGYPINTTEDDIFYITSPDGRRSYYSSFQEDRGEGEKDLYIIERPDVKEPPLTLLKGYISVPEGQKLPDDILVRVTDNETGELVQVIRPIRRTGGYVIIIPPCKNYNITYEANGVEFYNENVYIPCDAEYQEIKKELLLNPVKIGSGDADVVVIKEDITKGHVEDTTTTVKAVKRQWLMRYAFLAAALPDGLIIQYLDDNGQIIFTEVIGKNGYFRFRKLPLDMPFIFKLQQDDKTLCKELEIVLEEDGDFKYTLVTDDDCVFKKTEATEMPKSIEISFVHHFTYNSNTIVPNNEKYVTLVDSIFMLTETRGWVDISVECSASRVPTRTYKDNETLAKLRAKEAKKQLTEVLVSKGLNQSKINFFSTSTLVQGPTYKGDYLKNRATYEKFQYVKLFIDIKY